MLSTISASSRVQSRVAAPRRPSVVVRAQQINPNIKKDVEKVVDTKKISELPKKFPMCDGSHMAHNKETGDNVGPLIVDKSE